LDERIGGISIQEFMICIEIAIEFVIEFVTFRRIAMELMIFG